MNVLKGLLKSRKMWLAIVGVVQTIVFHLLPDFPAEVWQAINVLLLAVIGGIAVEDAAEKINKREPPIRILPAALQGDVSSMEGPSPSVRAWEPPPESSGGSWVPPPE